MSLEVTGIRTFKSNFDSGSNVGYGMITFNETMTVKFNIRKSHKNGNTFVSWPQKKNEKNEYTMHITFDDKDAQKEIDGAILEDFNKVLGIQNGGKSGKKPAVKFVKKDEPKSDEPADEPQEEPTQEAPKKKKKISWKS